MEALAQQLQDALDATGKKIAVHLGSEYLSRQPKLPHIVVAPGGGTYGPPDGSVRGGLASLTLDTHIICKAVKFEEAALLAEFAYVTLGLGKTARLALRSEVWDNYTVRVADLTLSLPGALTRDDITRVKVTHFIQHAQITPLTITPEVPDDQESPTGSTVFQE